MPHGPQQTNHGHHHQQQELMAEAVSKKNQKRWASPGRARTCDLTVNSRALYLLSYGGLLTMFAISRDPEIINKWANIVLILCYIHYFLILVSREGQPVGAVVVVVDVDLHLGTGHVWFADLHTPPDTAPFHHPCLRASQQRPFCSHTNTHTTIDIQREEIYTHIVTMDTCCVCVVALIIRTAQISPPPPVC